MSERDAAERAGNFDEVAFGYSARRGARRGEPLSAVQEPHVRAGLPGQHPHQGLHRRDHRRRPSSRRRRAQGAQRASRRVRARVPARGAVRGGVRAGQEGRAGRDRASRALSGRLRPDLRPRAQVRAGDSPAERQALRGGGIRSGRARVRRRAGASRPRGHRARVAACARRGAHLRHPRVPAAQVGRRGRDRGARDDGRRHRMRPGGGLHRHRRRAHDRGGLRRGLHRQRGRPAGVHGHPGREPQRRLLGERVPHAREPHARLRVPQGRHAGVARAQGRGRGRRERGDGRGAHRASPGRRGGVPRVPSNRRGDARTRRGGPPRRRGGHRVQDAVLAARRSWATTGG